MAYNKELLKEAKDVVKAMIADEDDVYDGDYLEDVKAVILNGYFTLRAADILASKKESTQSSGIKLSKD